MKRQESKDKKKINNETTMKKKPLKQRKHQRVIIYII